MGGLTIQARLGALEGVENAPRLRAGVSTPRAQKPRVNDSYFARRPPIFRASWSRRACRVKHHAGDYIFISIASATSTVPCSRCAHPLAIFRAASMLPAFTTENPVKRFDPPPSDTPRELTVLGFPKGLPGLTKASPRP